mmetsp:Transcript_53000/g.158637  ORF Transcript_53000/g.158637 Transcript_53000/m.158637 type:complete len:220 (-) Transcript_53000:182-841(-)
MQVVLSSQHHGERLVRLEQMTQIGAIVVLTRTAIALSVNFHPVRSCVLRPLDPYRPVPCEECPVTPQPRGVTAVEGIHPPRRAETDALLVTDPQQMPRLLPPASLVEQGHHPPQQIPQFLPSLPQRSADRVPVERKGRQIIHAVRAQFDVDPPVYHGVHGLIVHVRQMLEQGAGLPPVGPFDRRRQRGPIDVMRRKLVEGDDDVGADLLLRDDGALGGE